MYSAGVKDSSRPESLLQRTPQAVAKGWMAVEKGGA